MNTIRATYCDLSGYSPVTVTWEGYVQTIDSSELSTYERSGWAVFKGNAYADKMYIDANATVDTVYTESGSNTKIRNNGSVGTITTGAGSNTTIRNNGSVAVINTGASSNTSISNYNNIGIINTGVSSNMSINNVGSIVTINTGSESYTFFNNIGIIAAINTGAKSTNDITNSGGIIGINTGLNNSTTINNYGFIVVTGGYGKIFFNSDSSLTANEKAINEAYKELWDAVYKQYPVARLRMAKIAFITDVLNKEKDTINKAAQNMVFLPK